MRNLHQIIFQDDVVNQLEIINECNDIDVLVQDLETTLHDIFEAHAPLIAKSVAFRHRCPWFIGIIKQQKRTVRSERIWHKYRENNQWHAYRNEKMKYNNMLKEAKKNTISEKIYACNGDTRKLYKLVSELMSSVKENPLPLGKSNKDVAEEFVDFFLSKIQRMHYSWKALKNFHHNIMVHQNLVVLHYDRVRNSQCDKWYGIKKL